MNSRIQFAMNHKKFICKITFLFFLVFSLNFAFAHEWSGKDESLEKNFKKLSRSYKNLQRSSNINDISEAYDLFYQNLQTILNFEIAANLEETEVFLQGMNELEKAVESLGQSIKNNDSLRLINEKILIVGKLRKQYHKKLNIDD